MKFQLFLLIATTHLLKSSYTYVDAFAIETTASRRLGKRSFIQKQETGRQQNIATPAELHDLALKNALKTPGSGYHRNAWKYWLVLSIETTRYDLSENLPSPVDKARFENLFFRLGVAADKGEMPSFRNAGARSAYALEFFCRGRKLADLFMDAFNPSFLFPEYWKDALLESPMLGGNYSANESYNMVSLGGGPGFDFVGAALAATFCASGGEAAAIKATILDYEEGWGDLVEAMDVSTRNILQQPNLSCQWGGKCDITKPLADPTNAACLAEISSTQLWTCQYCVAENAHLLRESNYVFFHDLFEMAPEGALFIITEVTPRLWPEFYNLMEEHCTYMQVGFNKKGGQMLLRKSSGQSSVLISDRDAKQLKTFEMIAKQHERKVQSGWERQEQKVRGMGYRT